LVALQATAGYTQPCRPAEIGQERTYIELFFIGCAMSSVAIYDVVKVKKLHRPIDFRPDGISVRAPIVSDVAAVIEVYTTPPDYELECSGKDGITIWLHAFAPEDVELEVTG
jgi:hypothetical protein